MGPGFVICSQVGMWDSGMSSDLAWNHWCTSSLTVGLGFSCGEITFLAWQTLQGHSSCGLHSPEGVLILAFLVNLTSLSQKARCLFLTAAHPVCSQVARALLSVGPTYGFPLATRPESTSMTLQLHKQAVLPVHSPDEQIDAHLSPRIRRAKPHSG